MPSVDSLRLKTIVSAPFAENTYVAQVAGRGDCLVFDPGLEPGKIVSYIEAQGLTPTAFLITHGHSDHIAGNAKLKQRWPECPIVIGRGDAEKLINPELNLSAAFGVPLTSPPADKLLDEGDIYEGAGFRLEVREIPGHSSGHIVFICHDVEPTIVFGGDVLFAGSIGRTDFPDGDFDQLADGIRRKLYTLPDDTIILPGHGGPTTTGEEKESNPFVSG